MKTLAYISFSDAGEDLGKLLQSLYGGDAVRCGQPDSLSEWTQNHFDTVDALIYIGAVGIAVRAIAPYVKDKTTDPAVIVIDDAGKYCIPILSGHIGGANNLAKQIADKIHAQPVITTATDNHAVFAVDSWAVQNGMSIVEPERIVQVSSRLLAGRPVRYYSIFPIEGECPTGLYKSGREEADMIIDIICRPGESALHLIPRRHVLGIGCRRGVSVEQISACFKKLTNDHRLNSFSFAHVVSIDRKKDEPAILEFCKLYNCDFTTFSAKTLMEQTGEFHSSDFVMEITGADNICERSVCAFGAGLIIPRISLGPVTMAAGVLPAKLQWS